MIALDRVIPFLPIPVVQIMQSNDIVPEVSRLIFVTLLSTRTPSSILSWTYWLGPTTAGLAASGHLLFGSIHGTLGNTLAKRIVLGSIGYALTTSFVRDYLNKLYERTSFFNHEPDVPGNTQCFKSRKAYPRWLSNEITKKLPRLFLSENVRSWSSFFVMTAVGLATAYSVAWATVRVAKSCGITPDMATLVAGQIFPYQVKIWLGFTDMREGFKKLSIYSQKIREAASREEFFANKVKAKGAIFSCIFNLHQGLSGTNENLFLSTYPLTYLMRQKSMFPKTFRP